MAGMVGSAVVQEAVSGVVSLVLRNREEKVFKRYNMERLVFAHSELTLERSAKLPITDVSLLRRRKVLKRAYEECDVLYKHKLRILGAEEAEQTVTTSCSSNFPKRITRALKSSFMSLFSLNRDDLTCSDVGRFELFADKACKFVRDVASGCSLAYYRFFCPLIRQLVEGKSLECEMVEGCRTRCILIVSTRSEEHGVEVYLWYDCEDRKIPMRGFTLRLGLRLSEGMDMVGLTAKRLQSLEPECKSFAEVAMGELAQLLAQDASHFNSAVTRASIWARERTFLGMRSDPFYFKANGYWPWVRSVVAHEVLERHPEHVSCCIIKCIGSLVLNGTLSKTRGLKLEVRCLKCPWKKCVQNQRAGPRPGE